MNEKNSDETKTPAATPPVGNRPKRISLAAGNAQEAPARPKRGDREGFNDEDEVRRDYTLWSSADNVIFQPSRSPIEVLPPGLYEIMSNPNIGLYFNRVKFSTENVIKFPDTNSEKVIDEITNFWSKEDVFKSYGLSFKRGILLYGPPGSGKTSTIKLVIEDVINRGGVVLKFDHPELFSGGMRILRNIQPTTPVVVLMEDLDSILECFNESDVINILDGVDRIEKILFLATTNYIEKLGPRIANRPSRFDRRFKIDVPSDAARKMYFENVMLPGDVEKYGVDIDEWVEDTKGMSIAHLKELVTSVVILGTSYEETLENLENMKKELSSGSEDEGSVGFETGSD